MFLGRRAAAVPPFVVGGAVHQPTPPPNHLTGEHGTGSLAKFPSSFVAVPFRRVSAARGAGPTHGAGGAAAWGAEVDLPRSAPGS